MNLSESLMQVLAPILVKVLSNFRQPKMSGEKRLPGLFADVEVFFDEWGVPHIYAQSMGDLLFAQGYLHAQERLFQMDIQRRLGSGRLSEVFGKDALQADRWMRVLSFQSITDKEVRLLDSQDRVLMESYCSGINAFIQGNRLPYEFILTGYRPEPWRIQDSLLWVKMMALNLSTNWDIELVRKWLIEKLGKEKADLLQVDAADEWPVILSLPTMLGEDRFPPQQVRKYSGPGAAEGVGSNNWVISGERTKNGKPILANDMHLGLTVPSIWYENHLEAPGFRVAGLSLLGIPFVIAGHNENVAWGYTAGFADTQDLFEEHLKEENGHTVYEYCGKWLDADIRIEKIKVKGGDVYEEKVISTHHGPIINPLILGDVNLPPMALRWDIYDADKNPAQVIKLVNRAKNCIELREAFSFWVHPTQNVVYADTQGNIGYSLVGRVPIRKKGDGSIPVPGWDGEFEWIGYIPFDDMPHLYNPDQGYVATANNRTAPPDYPYWLSSDYIRGHRCARISELILQHPMMDLETTQNMQIDQISHPARSFIATLGKIETDDSRLGDIIKRLKSWDGLMSADSFEATFYHEVVKELFQMLLADRLGDLLPYYLSKSNNPIAGGNIWGEHAYEWLDIQLRMPNSIWFTLEEGKSKEDIILIAIKKTVKNLEDRFGADMKHWSWGKIHTLTLRHHLAGQQALAPVLNLGPYPVGGDGSTIWAEFCSPLDNNYGVTGGPPFRFIADFSDLDHCLGVMLPGQSGNPGNPHYADQVQDWLTGSYHTMYYARQDVESNCKQKLLMRASLVVCQS
jgi:penicillin amidase